jgi:hypothetical protein
MNERIQKLAEQAGLLSVTIGPIVETRHMKKKEQDLEKFAELIMQDMHKKVIASILITDVVMEEKGQVPTSEDYIRAINKDFGVEE